MFAAVQTSYSHQKHVNSFRYRIKSNRLLPNEFCNSRYIVYAKKIWKKCEKVTRQTADSSPTDRQINRRIGTATDLQLAMTLF